MAASMQNMCCKSPLLLFARHLLVRRHICTCHYLQNDVFQSKTMQKLLSKQKSKRVGHILIKAPGGKVQAGPKPTKIYRKMTAGSQKRLEQMAVIYHEHIAQLVSEGEVDTNIEILRIQVLPDMSSVNVYWEASGDKDKDGAMQQLLEEKAGFIRHSLHCRNILGYIPKIVFVKDLAAFKLKKLDEIFTRLNLNPSCLPEEYAESSDSQDDDTVANMKDDKFRQDLYGLKHDMLMEKVVSAKQGRPAGPEIVVSDVDPELMSRLARKDYVQKFSKHLKGQKILKEKQRRIQDYLSDRHRENEEMVDYDKGDDIEEDFEYNEDHDLVK